MCYRKCDPPIGLGVNLEGVKSESGKAIMLVAVRFPVGYLVGYLLCHDSDAVRKLLGKRRSGHMVRLGARAMLAGHEFLGE